MGRSKKQDIVAPTPEQRRAGIFELAVITDKAKGGTTVTIGKAYRRRPVFETLGDEGYFSSAELKALRHYRHHADIADRSPLLDSLGRMERIGGSGSGPTIEILSAIRVRDDCERAAGALQEILRAVIVEDVTLSQWAIRQAGARQECSVKSGKRVCRYKPKRKALEIAQLEIKIVAKRVQAELDA